MRLMRAVFSCGRNAVEEVVKIEGLEATNLALHEESNEEEAIVSGNVFAVMLLIGFMSKHGFNKLDECWQYEC